MVVYDIIDAAKNVRKLNPISKGMKVDIKSHKGRIYIYVN